VWSQKELHVPPVQYTCSLTQNVIDLSPEGYSNLEGGTAAELTEAHPAGCNTPHCPVLKQETCELNEICESNKVLFTYEGVVMCA
jgi:hypothetical protein